MTREEEDFERQLDVFRSEVRLASQFFYTFLTLNTEVARNASAKKITKQTPLFWATVLGALETAFFIAWGRVFDNKDKSKHNVHRLLKVAKDNRDKIFSRDALEARKRQGAKNADEWIDGYVGGAYVPTVADFVEMEKQLDHYKQLHEKYREIRDKVHAHKDLSETEKISDLYAKTDIGEIQKLFAFLNRFGEDLWELFHNGRMSDPKTQEGYVKNLTVEDVERFVRILSSAPNQ